MDTILDIPYDIEAEKVLLGKLIYGTADTEKDVDKAVEILKEECFYGEDNRLIFKTIVELRQKSKPIDQIILQKELIKTGRLEKVGGYEKVINLSNNLLLFKNVDEYIEILLNLYRLRTIIETAKQMQQLARSGKNTPDEIVDKAEKSIYQLALTDSKNRYTILQDVLQETFEEIEEKYKNKTPISGLATGFIDFDRKTTGLKGSTLTILAARPGMGKSALALNIASNVAIKENKSVLVFNMEMSKNEIAKRLLASETLIDNQKFSTGNLTPDEWDKIAAKAEVLGNAKIYIDDTPGINIMEIRSKARSLAAESLRENYEDENGNIVKITPKPLGLIVIDYLQLIEPAAKSSSTREQEIAQISRSLKKLSMELDIPIIALSQLSRSVEKGGEKTGRRPMLSDLRESGAIEQDADMVLFIYRDDYYNKESEKANIAELIIAKQRGGSLGTVELAWMGNFTKFDNLAHTEDQRYA